LKLFKKKKRNLN